MNTVNIILIIILAVVITAWIIVFFLLRRKLKALEGINGVGKKDDGGNITIHL